METQEEIAAYGSDFYPDDEAAGPEGFAAGPQDIEISSLPPEQPTIQHHPLMLSDPRHVYVGTDNRGDVYQLVDEGGNVVEWAVPVNAGSGDIIADTIRNLGAPSSMTAAQTPGIAAQPGTVQPAGAGVSATATNTLPTAVASDPRHVYVGTDNRGDVYQLVDEGGNVVEWAVKVNDDSRNALGGTVRNLGNPSSMTVAQGTAYVAPVATVATVPAVISPTNGVPGAVRINPTNTPATSPGSPRQSNSRHVYVGRDSRGDVWQIFDGTNVIEWAVNAGDESGNMIPGSARNLGAPSSATKAQNDGTPVGGPAESTLTPIRTYGTDTGTSGAAGGTSIATIIIGAAGLLISALR